MTRLTNRFLTPLLAISMTFGALAAHADETLAPGMPVETQEPVITQLLGCGLTVTLDDNAYPLGMILVAGLYERNAILAGKGTPSQVLFQQGRGIKLGSYAIGSFKFVVLGAGITEGAKPNPVIRVLVVKKNIVSPKTKLKGSDVIDERLITVPMPNEFDYSNDALFKSTETLADLNMTFQIECGLVQTTFGDAPSEEEAPAQPLN